MARFDVHRVAGQRGFLLDVQADHLAALPSRIVVPLLPPSTALPAIRDLNPVLRFDGKDVALMTHYLTAVPRAELGPAIGNLAAERDAITRALDLLLTGF
jgi:toxin CcdB